MAYGVRRILVEGLSTVTHVWFSAAPSAERVWVDGDQEWSPDPADAFRFKSKRVAEGWMERNVDYGDRITCVSAVPLRPARVLQ